MPIDAGPCSCPLGWPQLLHHKEDGWPVTVVKHDSLRCWASSYSVRGIERPRSLFKEMVAAALGEKVEQTSGERWGS